LFISIKLLFQYLTVLGKKELANLFVLAGRREKSLPDLRRYRERDDTNEGTKSNKKEGV